MNLKELQQLIKLCRKFGIESIKYEGIELVFGSEPLSNGKQEKPRVTVQTDDGELKDITQLTPEQILFYSVNDVTTEFS
jgi:hypothetical protein